MTAYNDLRFLDEAVDSILRQEFSDLEFIIVDDGTGQSAIFDALQERDPRIRVVVNPTNLGGAAAANRGIEVARSEIIARMDADDVAEPTRIGRLVAALADEPQVGLVGSSVTLIDELGRPQGVQRMPESDLAIRWTMLFHNPFYHPTVAFRRSCFEEAGRYRTGELVSYDHYLWFQMLKLCRARNITEPLVRYRLNPLGLTAIHAKNARGRTHPIRKALWAELGVEYDLYDDVFARELSLFLRGGILGADRRAAAYSAILNLLRTFLAARMPLTKEDAASAQHLASAIVARVLAEPPARRRDALMIYRSCWRINPRSTVQACLERLLGRWPRLRTVTAFARGSGR